MTLRPSVLNDYMAADETERLYLFLAHPDFRDRFIKIDMGKSSHVTPHRSIATMVRRFVRVRKLKPAE
jgi:hypothetical protein